MARGTHRCHRMDSNFAGKVVASMRNNDKTSAIDCRGYILSFDVILSPMVRSLASHNRHGV
jgi:hypothetical protein